MKIAIVGGAGRVGSNAAFVLQLKGIGDEIVLVDVNTQGAAGEALDLLHGSAGTKGQIFKSGGMDLAEGSDIVVITAGLRRRPDESRLDLINRNVKLFLEILSDLRKLALPPHVKLLVVTNPVDILTYLAVEKSGLSPRQVIGLGTVLDSLRFRSLLADAFSVNATQVSALILGEHGDSMVPLWSTVSVNGIPLTSLSDYDQDVARKVFERTRKGGAEVIKLKGGAGYAVGIAISQVVDALSSDVSSILPVSTLQDGCFGIRDVCLSIPTRISCQGIEECLEIELWPKERSALIKSADSLRSTLAKVL